MDVPCRFPGLAGFGNVPVVEDVFVEPGEKVWIGRPVLAVAVEGAAFHLLSNVQGLIREVRLRKATVSQPAASSCGWSPIEMPPRARASVPRRLSRRLDRTRRSSPKLRPATLEALKTAFPRLPLRRI